ncbi:MAG: PKD domain-containing protein [Candidatus Bathyarchaeia archaeon]
MKFQKKIIPLLLVLASGLVLLHSAQATFLFVNVSTDHTTYQTGDTVHITGNVTYGTGLVSDALVAVQMVSPGGNTMVLRTVSTGTVPSSGWPVIITAVYSCDSLGNPKTLFQRGSTANVRILMIDNGSSPIYVMPALYIQFSNNIPYEAYYPFGVTQLEAFTLETFQSSIYIPVNAPTGLTNVYANVYTQAPQDGGYPLCPEAQANFTIVTPSTPAPQNPTPPNFTLPISMSLAQPGTWTVYATTNYQNGGPVTVNLSFSLTAKALPPVASYVYSPDPTAVNLATTFDGSPSLAHGFNNTIIQYAWNFGDGTPMVINKGTFNNPPTPRVTHTFNSNMTYTVTLNVTDNQSLSNTISQSIRVNSTLAPTAAFTWTAQFPIVLQTATFNATTSRPGWNGTGYTTIVNFQWNFGDGTVQNTSQPTITHIYQNSINATVTLTITDSLGSQSSAVNTVYVLTKPQQLSPDVNGDGRVSMADVVLVLIAFGSTPSKPNWNPACDITQQGKVDMSDVVIVLVNFGKYI